MKKSYSIILKDQSFQIPRSLKMLNKVSEKISTQLLNDNEYRVMSNVHGQHLESFLDFLMTEQEYPNINVDNIYDYRLLFFEFDILTDFIAKQEYEDVYKIAVLKNIADSDDVLNKFEIEEYISSNLDYYLDNYASEMYNIPFASLYNIFNYPERNLSNHELAYQFITNQNDYSSLFILLGSLDSKKLTAKTMIDSILNRKNHSNYVPVLDFSFIYLLNQIFTDFKIDTNCFISKSIEDLKQKVDDCHQLIQENNQLKKENEECKNQYLQNQQNLINENIKSIENLKFDFERRLKILEDQKNELKEENEGLKNRIKELEDNNNDLTNQLNDTNKTLKRLMDEKRYKEENESFDQFSVSQDSMSTCSINDFSLFDFGMFNSNTDDKLTITQFSRSFLYNERTNLTIKRVVIENKSQLKTDINGLLSKMIKRYTVSSHPPVIKYFIYKDQDFEVIFLNGQILLQNLPGYLNVQNKPFRGMEYRICVFFNINEFNISTFDANRDGIPFAVRYDSKQEYYDIESLILDYLFYSLENEDELKKSEEYKPCLYTYRDGSLEMIIDNNYIVENANKPVFVSMKSVSSIDFVFDLYKSHIEDKHIDLSDC